MRVLIVKLSSIGDIVHTLPAVAAIRREMPTAEISWVVEERSAEIIRDNILIDNLIEIDTRSMRGGRVIEEILLDMSKQARAVRSQKYDIAIDFQGLLKSAVIAKISGAKQRWGFSRQDMREAASRFLLTDTIGTLGQINISRKNLHLAAGALGFKYDDSLLEFPIATRAEHSAEAEAVAELTGGNFAILNPGGGWVTKLWHAEKFGHLADRIWEEMGMVSVVATGPDDAELANTVAANSRTGKVVIAQPSLKGLYELARRSTVYVGGDTGPTHIAVAAGAPIVGLFGPTEWWRNGSPREDDICVERNDIDCREDCHRRTCTKWICMDSDVDTAFTAVKARLAIAKKGTRSDHIKNYGN